MLTSLLWQNKLFMQQNIFLNKQHSVIQKSEPLKLNVCCSNELDGLGLNTVRIILFISISRAALRPSKSHWYTSAESKKKNFEAGYFT